MVLTCFFKKFAFFELLVSILIVLQLAHLCILFSERSFPMPLLYAPLFWAMCQSLTGAKSSVIKRDFLIGNIPFVTFLIISFRLGDALGWTYFRWYLPVMMFLQIGGAVAVFIRLAKLACKSERTTLLKQLMALTIGIALFVGALFLQLYLKIDLIIGIEPIQAIVIVTCFSLFLLTNHIYAVFTGQIIAEKSCVDHDELVKLDAGQLQYCQTQLSQVMDVGRLYLDSKLSLDKLSQHTGIAKNTISQYLHTQLGSTYYEWLATYRIAYAQQLLQEYGNDYKLEAVANAAGFCSKTSFNRYFKEIVGVSPSVYREQVGFA